MARRTPIVLFLALPLLATPLHAQMDYEDPLSRFAITLPEGFELSKETADKVYQFKHDNMNILAVVQDGTDNAADAFRGAADFFTGQTVPPPPEGSVYELTVNGNAARQATYPFEAKSGKKTVTVHFFIGAVTLEGTGMSVAYMTMLNEKMVKKMTPVAWNAFHSIRIPGTPVIEAGTPVAVTGALEGGEPPAVAAPEVPPSTFESPLATIDVGAGWTATAGKGYNIVAIEREGYRTVRVIGAKKNDFGKSREEILESMVEGIQSAMPTARQTSPPREEATTAGDVVLIGEYEGTIVVDGKELPHWALIASFKDKKRGLGYLWITTPNERDKALEEVLAMIRSTR